MNHCGTRNLETPRLLLRPLTMDDAQMMYDNWASDPAVTKYLRWEPHPSWVYTAELLHEWSKHYADPAYYQWGICEKDTGVLFGSLCLGPGEPDPVWQEPMWEPGYCIGRRWWNQGYTTEALCAVRDFWFTTVGGDLLACCHAVDNPASGAVMRKAGFVYHHDSVYHKYDGTEVPCKVYLLEK